MPDYLDFHLAIESLNTGGPGPRYQARIISAPVGGSASVGFDLPADALHSGQPGDGRLVRGPVRRNLGSSSDAAEQPGAFGRTLDDARRIGGALFERVFGGKVGEGFLRSLDAAVDAAGVRIRLRLDNVPELVNAPWEYLYRHEVDQFFALQRRTPIVRYIELPLPFETMRVAPPLNLLVVISSPRGYPRLDVDAEWAALQKDLKPLHGTVHLTKLGSATLQELQGLLRRDVSFHILHFIGHADFSPAAQAGALLLEDEQGDGCMITADHLKVHLRDHPSFRLVVLNACEGARTSPTAPFAGMAQSLTQIGVPATIAMQSMVTDKAALALTSEFYKALLVDRNPVDGALAEARKSIFDAGLGLEWATPVLYMRAPDGRIFDVQREGLRIDERGQAASTPTPAPLPPEPQTVPSIDRLVGRKADLAWCQARLAEERTVAIVGMPGIGKRAFAAMLARSLAPEKDLFWHEIGDNEGLRTLIRKLAGFLAWNGLDGPWRMLQGQPDVDEVTLGEMMLDYVRKSLSGRQTVLCLIHFQRVADDPLVRRVLERLRYATDRPELSIVLVSERELTFLGADAHRGLTGLNLAETRELLAARGVALAAPVLADLQQQTGGHPQLLVLAANALKEATDPAAMVHRLVEDKGVEMFLEDAVYDVLSVPERQVLTALAVMGDHTSTIDAVEEVLDGAPVREPIDLLEDRSLTTRTRGENGWGYGAHAMVRAYYANRMTKRERLAMNRRAGAFYADSEPDALRAALHFERAGEAARAAEVVTRDVWWLINRGYARALGELLERLGPTQLDSLTWARVLLARGLVHTQLGEGGKARESFQAALAAIDALTRGPDRAVFKARVYLGLGELLKQDYQTPREAVAALEQGLEALGEGEVGGGVGDGGRETEAALRIELGSALIATGDHTAASAALEQGLALLPPGPRLYRARGLINLGVVRCAEGDIAEGNRLTMEGLAISEALGDQYSSIAALTNLAQEKHMAGDWPGALGDGYRAAEIAERLDVAGMRASVDLTMGVILMTMGDYPAARERLEHSRDLAHVRSLPETEIAALASLADLHVRQGALDQAASVLDVAAPLAEKHGAVDQMPEIVRHTAELRLARGDAAGAEAAIRRSLALARAEDLAIEEGVGLRVLGRVLGAKGREAEAMTAFEQAVARLDGLMGYEAARAKLDWGQALLASADAASAARGAALVAEARAVLRGLGVGEGYR